MPFKVFSLLKEEKKKVRQTGSPQAKAKDRLEKKSNQSINQSRLQKV